MNISAFALIDKPIATTPPNQFDIDGYGAIKIPFGYLLETDLRKAWQMHTHELPNQIKRKLYHKLKERIERDSDKPIEQKIKAVSYAILNLQDQVSLLNKVIKKESLWLVNGKLIKNRAKIFANKVTETLAQWAQLSDGSDEHYHRVLVMVSQAAITQFHELGVVPPFKAVGAIEYLEGNIVRYQNEDFLINRFEIQAAQLREHIEIIMGNVNHHMTPYCSLGCIREYIASKKQQDEWLKTMFVQDQDDEENFFCLADAVKRSTSNPTLRRHELMTRMRGFEDLAAEQGYSACMVTLTAPSKYHAYNKGLKRRNGKYQGATPKQTQQYLVKTWAKCRSKLSREELPFYGLRVVEPHHDGTPHWHMMLFYQPEHQKQIQQIIFDYAVKEDRHELNDDSDRCDFIDIEPSQGSATGYIAKYISKNIDASYIKQDLDDETGKPIADNVSNVLAWASRWRIRQFQFFGGAPVSVWRECRRFMKDFSINKVEQDGHFQGISFLPNFINCLDFANSGNFGGFVSASGGVFQGRQGALKTLYEELENDYGEMVKKITGFTYNGFEFVTRDKKYKIVTESSLLKSASGAPWSADNNCTVGLSHSEKLGQQIRNNGSRLQNYNKFRLESEPTNQNRGSNEYRIN